MRRHRRVSCGRGLTRRGFARFVIAGAALIGSRPARAGAPEFHYKLANDLPLDHPNTVRSKQAAARILRESDGRLKIDVFANNVLGGDTAMLSQLRSGALEFFALAGDILATVLPVADLAGMPYAFKDYKAVWAAVDGDLGAYLRNRIAPLGIHVFDRWSDLGFRQITTGTKPIRTPADLTGFKIRVPFSPTRLSMFKALGASPTTINFAELYSALQTRLVDGQETPLVVIETAKLYEVQKYCSLTRHSWTGTMMLANMRAWQRLPEDLRALVARSFDEAALKSRADVATLESAARSRMEQKGLVFNDPDPEPFRTALSKAGFYREWRGRYGEEAWSLLEKYSGPLA